jgi:hypothetical protein
MPPLRWAVSAVTHRSEEEEKVRLGSPVWAH